MSDPFYRAPKVLLKDTNVSPAAKLVRIVQAHWLSFEGRDATVRELVEATGLSERGVRNVLAGRKSAAPARSAARSAAQNPAQNTGKPAQNTVPSCSKSLSVMRDVDKGERDTAPLSPLAARGGKKETAQGDGTVAVLATKARMGGGTWPFERWAGQTEEDGAARRYTRAELAAYVEDRTSITVAPWRLAEHVRRHADARARAAFDARIREIQYGGLTRAEPVLGINDARKPAGADVRYRVRWSDDGLLMIHTETRAGERWFDGGQAYRYEVHSLAAASCWKFRPYQPRLFE